MKDGLYVSDTGGTGCAIEMITLVCLAVVVIVAGHGIGSLLMLLVRGEDDALALARVILAAGCDLSIAGFLSSRSRYYRGIATLAWCLYLGGWSVCLGITENAMLTVMTSIPFLLAAGFRVWHLYRKS